VGPCLPTVVVEKAKKTKCLAFPESLKFIWTDHEWTDLPFSAGHIAVSRKQFICPQAAINEAT